MLIEQLLQRLTREQDRPNVTASPFEADVPGGPAGRPSLADGAAAAARANRGRGSGWGNSDTVVTQLTHLLTSLTSLTTSHPILTPPTYPPLTPAMAAVEVLHAGWASKEGGLVKNWKRRYFVLRTRLTGDRLCPESANATHILLYFKSTGQALAGKASTGAIPITPGATEVTEHVRKNKRCVKIKSPGDPRAYFLVSEGGSVGNASWIEALTTLSTPDNAAELRRQFGQMPLGDQPPAAVKHLDGQQENAAGGSHASAIS